MSDFGEIELLPAVWTSADEEGKRDEERLEQARRLVDEARTAIAGLAGPAVQIVALRLMGAEVDANGKPVTEEREATALAILDRVGIPKLRATAIAASIAVAPQKAAPGSPGWEPAVAVEGEEEGDLELGSVDAQITAFLHGMHAAREFDQG